MKKINVLVVSAVILVFTACKKESSTSATVLAAVTVENLMADTIIGFTPMGQPYGSGKFTFYSLAENKIIPQADSATTKWDLAFRGTTIMTNAGTSGPGNGGAFVQVGLFADVKTVSNDSTFRVDASPTFAISNRSNQSWYVYDAPTNLITPIPGRVLVVRTATGKYAKVEILNYYKGGVTPNASAPDAEKISKQRYYTFRFVYQANGSKNF